ncbi:MAG: hypothetical protein U0744_06560 [Gemmataceae bacterium]
MVVAIAARLAAIAMSPLPSPLVAAAPATPAIITITTRMHRYPVASVRGGTAAVYSPGAYTSTGNWSGGACTNCGPNTVYSGQTAVIGMTNGNNMIQQANYTLTHGGGSIVLTVPENAEVMWGGQPVYGSGTTRRFVTLPIQGNNGAQQFQVRWMGPNGQWVTRNQTINATANQQVSYDFTNPNAAASGQAGGQFGTEEAQKNPNSQNKQGSGTDLNPATPRKLPAPTPNNQNNNPNPGTSINPQPSTTQPGTRPNNDTLATNALARDVRISTAWPPSRRSGRFHAPRS